MTVKYAVQSHVHDVIEWRSSGNGNTIRRRKSNFTAERSLAGRELDTPRAPPQRPAMPCQSHAPLARGEVLILIPRASARRSISTLLTIAPLLDAQWCEVMHVSRALVAQTFALSRRNAFTKAHPGTGKYL